MIKLFFLRKNSGLPIKIAEIGWFKDENMKGKGRFAVQK
jgi:hypothetical protein